MGARIRAGILARKDPLDDGSPTAESGHPICAEAEEHDAEDEDAEDALDESLDRALVPLGTGPAVAGTAAIVAAFVDQFLRLLGSKLSHNTIDHKQRTDSHSCGYTHPHQSNPVKLQT